MFIVFLQLAFQQKYIYSYSYILQFKSLTETSFTLNEHMPPFMDLFPRTILKILFSAENIHRTISYSTHNAVFCIH